MENSFETWGPAMIKRTGKVNATCMALQAAFRYSLVLLEGEEDIAHFNTMDECNTLVKALVKDGEKWYVRDNQSGLQMAKSFGDK